MMSPRDRKTVDLAISILRSASKATETSLQTEAVRLSLRVLLPHIAKHRLVTFWIVADNPNPMQRRGHLRDMVREFAQRTGAPVGLDDY